MSISSQTLDYGDKLYNLSIENGWSGASVGKEEKIGQKEGKGAQLLITADKEAQVTKGNSQMVATLREVFEKAGQVGPEFKNSQLGQMLKNDPCWNAMTSTNSKAGDTPPKPKDVVNFFLLVFKYMKADMQQNSQLELNQALNMIVQSKLLDNLTLESVTTMNDMKTQIADAKSKLDGPAGLFLSIGLPIILGVVSAGAMAGAGAVVGTIAKAAVMAAGVASGALASTVGNITSGEHLADMSNAATLGQANMSIGSSASESAQNMIKQGLQGQQNAESNKQTDLSMIQQAISNMVQSYGMGH